MPNYQSPEAIKLNESAMRLNDRAAQMEAEASKLRDEAACEAIAERWPSIAPPKGAIL